MNRAESFDRALSELSARPQGALRVAFVDRVMRILVQLAGKLPIDSLTTATGALSDGAALLAALDSKEGLGLISAGDPLAGARLRGLVARQKVLEAEGGILSADDVARLLRISRQAVYKRRRAGKLLAVSLGRHGDAYPSWQFSERGTLNGLEEVLNALASHDDWAKLAFFLEPHLGLGESRPLDFLRRGETQPVLLAAELKGEQAAI